MNKSINQTIYQSVSQSLQQSSQFKEFIIDLPFKQTCNLQRSGKAAGKHETEMPG
jgi:hypothetical protein